MASDVRAIRERRKMATGTQEAATRASARRQSGLAGLILKNVLFWGSIALSLYGLYALGSWLLG